MFAANYTLLFICMRFVLAFAINKEKESDTLILLHVVSRHGDRAPGTYPNDMYANYDYPMGPGGLTERGIRRVYEIGNRIRRRYSDLLDTRYHYKRIEALSSWVPRCRRSTQGILAGMYPLPGKESSCTVAQLVDFEYIPPSQDRVMVPFSTCPQIVDVNFTVLNRLCDGFEQVHTILKEYSGLPINKPFDVFLVYDALRSQEEYGLKLPDWADSIYPEPLATCSRDMNQAVVEDKKVLSYFSGNLIKKIVEDTIKKIEGHADYVDKRVYLYTGHDLTVVGLLGVLGLYNRQEISYGSHLMFEVHRIQDVVGLRVYHDNFDREGPRLLDIPDCGTFVSLEKFVNLTSRHFPIDWCNF